MTINWGEIIMQATAHQEEMQQREADYLKRNADAFLWEEGNRTSLVAKLLPLVRRVRIGRSKRPQSVRSIRPQHETS